MKTLSGKKLAKEIRDLAKRLDIDLSKANEEKTAEYLSKKDR